jgi:hypothetical protein
MIKRSKELTVEEIERNHGAIRDPPEVNRFTLSYNGISQRNEVPNGGARPDVLQVRPNGATLAMIREILELLFGRVDVRVQLVKVLLVELFRDGFVDVFDHCIVPERRIFLYGIETGNLSRANNIRSVNRIETATRTYNVYPTPRGSQETKS